MKTFEQWLTEHESAKKLQQHIPKPPSGVRDIRDDLSKDYPGDLENMGTVEPFKVVKAGSEIPHPKYKNEAWDASLNFIRQIAGLDKPSRIEALEGGAALKIAQLLMQKSQGMVDVEKTVQYLVQAGLDPQEAYLIINAMQ